MTAEQIADAVIAVAFRYDGQVVGFDRARVVEAIEEVFDTAGFCPKHGYSWHPGCCVERETT